MIETILLFVGGGILLVAGAEMLVRGASRLALGFGISPLVVGLTVVAFGTSAPELAVSIGASIGGTSGVALGNVVGSNIFNILLTLGLSALVIPLTVSIRLIRREIPLMIAISIITLVMALDGTIGRIEGTLLFAGSLFYTVVLIRQSRRENQENRVAVAEALGDTDAKREKAASTPLWKNILFLLLGLGGLVVGAEFLVASATTIAQALGMSDLVIGLTVVAAGTSLPELATSVIAAFRGERDIAVGNIVGSNIFNLLVVLGATGMISGDIPVPAGALTFDLPVMIAVAIAALPVLFTGLMINRWEGFVFVATYVFYTVHLVLVALDHPGLDEFSFAMTWFVIPLIVLTIGVISVQGWREWRQ